MPLIFFNLPSSYIIQYIFLSPFLPHYFYLHLSSFHVYSILITDALFKMQSFGRKCTRIEIHLLTAQGLQVEFPPFSGANSFS